MTLTLLLVGFSLLSLTVVAVGICLGGAALSRSDEEPLYLSENDVPNNGPHSSWRER